MKKWKKTVLTQMMDAGEIIKKKDAKKISDDEFFKRLFIPDGHLSILGNLQDVIVASPGFGKSTLFRLLTTKKGIDLLKRYASLSEYKHYGFVRDAEYWLDNYKFIYGYDRSNESASKFKDSFKDLKCLWCYLLIESLLEIPGVGERLSLFNIPTDKNQRLLFFQDLHDLTEGYSFYNKYYSHNEAPLKLFESVDENLKLLDKKVCILYDDFDLSYQDSYLLVNSLLEFWACINRCDQIVPKIFLDSLMSDQLSTRYELRTFHRKYFTWHDKDDYYVLEPFQLTVHSWLKASDVYPNPLYTSGIVKEKKGACCSSDGAKRIVDRMVEKYPKTRFTNKNTSFFESWLRYHVVSAKGRYDSMYTSPVVFSLIFSEAAKIRLSASDGYELPDNCLFTQEDIKQGMAKASVKIIELFYYDCAPWLDDLKDIIRPTIIKGKGIQDIPIYKLLQACNYISANYGLSNIPGDKLFVKYDFNRSQAIDLDLRYGAGDFSNPDVFKILNFLHTYRFIETMRNLRHQVRLGPIYTPYFTGEINA